MRVLVTGHHGYIGSVLVPMLVEAGEDVVGVDTYFYQGCDFGAAAVQVPQLRRDIRDLVPGDLAGFDAVIHLAALSNDPLGNLDPACTVDINERGSVHLAQLAKQAGVTRFLFSSSCSLYGAAGDGMVAEDAPMHPVTPYGASKVAVERALHDLADARFSPISLRNATAYGVSPRLRADLMVNNLVGHAHLSGEVLIQSDGTPWRPLVHVEDIAAAFLAVLRAPRDAVHNQAFNVGRSEENFRVREVAELVRDLVPGSRIVYAPGGAPDPRCYRVDADKLQRAVSTFRPRWTVRAGIAQLRDAYRETGLEREDFLGSRYQRLARIRELRSRGALDAGLRWTPAHAEPRVTTAGERER